MSDTDPYMAQDAVVETPVVEAPAPEAPESTVEAAPEGSIKEVLAWVGTDATRAQTALDAEKAGEKRVSLISKLEALTN